MIDKLLRKLGLHVHEWKPTDRIPTDLSSSERWYWKIEECDCGEEREIMA